MKVAQIYLNQNSEPLKLPKITFLTVSIPQNLISRIKFTFWKFLEHSAVWRFYNLLATQILREIKFWLFKRSKKSFLAFLEVLNFDLSNFETFLKSQIYQNSNLRDSEIVEMAIFDIQMWLKLISCKIEWLSLIFFIFQLYSVFVIHGKVIGRCVSSS